VVEDDGEFLCAADAVEAVGTLCGGAAGDCTTAGTCDGTSALCAGGTPLPATTLCLPRDAANPCDVDDYCDGVRGVCVLTYAVADTRCGPAPSGVCDAPDHCSGTSADCVPTFLAGLECRASVGGCDAAEFCTGGEANCPPDQFSPTGTVCRASTESCDPAESCDGTAASCPANVTMCGTSDDGGMGGTDVGPPVATEGCRCRVTPRAPVPVLGWVGLCVGLAWALGRRRH